LLSLWINTLVKSLPCFGRLVAQFDIFKSVSIDDECFAIFV